MARRAIAILTLLGLWVPTALADQIKLKNGDVITGTITLYEGDEVRIDVDYIDDGDDLVIDMENITSIETDEPMVWQFKDNSEVEGKIATDADGNVVIVDETGAEIPYDPEQLVDAEEIEDWFHYGGDINVGISTASGNTDTRSFHVDGSFEPVFGKNTFFLYGQLNREEASGVTTASNWRILGQYERELTYRWFAYANNQYDNDDLLGLNVRATFSGGMGFKLWQEAPRWLQFQLGPAYVHENWVRNTPDEDYAAMVWALAFDHEVFTPDLVFYHHHKYIQSVQEAKRFVIQTTTGMRYDLVWDLFGAVEVQWDWNNQPASGAQEDDTRVMFKLGYSY